jgi:hypothetical protein
METVLRAPRFGIAWIMAIIALAAINLAVLRAAQDHYNQTIELLLAGALPMVDVLTIGILAGYKRHDRRSFLLGFLLFGGLAASFYFFLVLRFSEEVVLPYVQFFLKPVWEMFREKPTPAFLLIAYPMGIVLLVWPQLAFALLGGYVSRRYKVTIVRREDVRST